MNGCAPAQGRTIFRCSPVKENTTKFRILVLQMEVTAATALAIGLAGGVLGGLMGLGGGIIMIPLLTFAAGSNPYLYQSASLLAAIAVSIGSIPRHVRSGMIDRPFVLRSLILSLPSVAASALTAALVSSPRTLELLFAVFLALVGMSEIAGLFAQTKETAVPPPARNTWPRAMLIGGCMGTLSGLLGVGGGIVALPMIRTLVRFDIRTAIATTAVLVLPTVIVGGLVRLAVASHTTSADGQPMTALSILILALLLSPGCLVGGALGASLVHRLPHAILVCFFGVACLTFAARMLGLF
jgi:uncharacterized membrane protein YfcA